LCRTAYASAFDRTHRPGIDSSHDLHDRRWAESCSKMFLARNERVGHVSLAQPSVDPDVRAR